MSGHNNRFRRISLTLGRKKDDKYRDSVADRNGECSAGGRGRGERVRRMEGAEGGKKPCTRRGPREAWKAGRASYKNARAMNLAPPLWTQVGLVQVALDRSLD